MQGARLLAYRRCILTGEFRPALCRAVVPYSTYRQVMSHAMRHQDGELDIAIIGGGMAGISAADYLTKASQLNTARVTLFDRGMSLGGRCSGRRMGSLETMVHHGCQLLHPQSQEFREVCEANGKGLEFSEKLVVIDPSGNIMTRGKRGLMGSNTDQFVGSSVSTIQSVYGGHEASRILDGYFQKVSEKVAHVHNHCAVKELYWSENSSRPWKVVARDTRNERDEIVKPNYHAVIIADWGAAIDLVIRPRMGKIPQLLQESLVGPGCVDQVEYLPTFALITEIESKGIGLHDVLGFDAAIVDQSMAGEGSLGSFKMIAMQATEQQSHDGTIREYWVLLTSDRKSREIVCKVPMYDSDGKAVPQTRLYRQALAEDLERDFRAAMSTLLGEKGSSAFHIKQSFGHRWGRAFPKPGTEIVLDSRSLYVSQYNMGICGDMFAANDCASPIEQAWQSGRAVAQSLVNYYSMRSKI